MKGLTKKFWTALVLFGLIGQVAWIVENMYLNVFIYKMFQASAADISFMVAASAVVASLTTIFMGALIDRIGERKLFICVGYLLWGITIFAFGFVRMDVFAAVGGFAVSMGKVRDTFIAVVIILDCFITFFGAMANDAAYNAWITEAGNENNRGKIEGINAMMPLISILVVFGGFMGLDLELGDSWTFIFFIIGSVVFVVGLLGFFLIEDVPRVKCHKTSYWNNLSYSFKPTTIKDNLLLYVVIGAFALFGISIQTFMPYLIVYYEKTLQMEHYVLIMAPAIVIASIVTAVYGRLYDQLGFQKSIIPCMAFLIGGYGILYFSVTTIPVFIGSLLMMCGYLTGMAVFGAIIRSRIPEHMAGQFQGIRIIGQVLIPGVVGPAIGAFVLREAELIENQDGTLSFLPDKRIWIAAILTALVVLVALYGIFQLIKNSHYDLMTRQEGKNSSKNWNLHPKPQLKRESIYLINEKWKLNGESINVPYPPQSRLSGCKKKVGKKLCYETEFEIPKEFTKEKILLHFGAVDQIAQVFVNGKLAGVHKGGYLAFTLEVSEYVTRTGVNKLVVQVEDGLSKAYPYGKQSKNRGGMWYTPVSGIWQSVWLENVPASYIESIQMTPDTKGVKILIEPENTTSFTVEIFLESEKIGEETFVGNNGYVNLSSYKTKEGNAYEPKLWSPKHPYLYDMKITTETDEVWTYFALRTISIEKVEGINRVCLNGKPIFMHGVLDQGYYCDGIYLPAKPEEYEKDILRIRELGFNMLRKHIKVEPECFYYYCDKHGMLVVQDMINNGSYSFLRDTALPTIGHKKRKDKVWGQKKRKEIFKEQTKGTIRQLYNHPCIIAYTIFNEGWGQFDSDLMYDYVKSIDGSRLIDSTSGWFWQTKSDFDSEHIYFKTIPLTPKERPLFLSECGGYSRLVEGHYYSKYNAYGYGNTDTEEALTEAIEKMYEIMVEPAISKGLCGCVYTQLSDVEDEINGLYTYDRQICKVNKEAMQQLAKRLIKS